MTYSVKVVKDDLGQWGVWLRYNGRSMHLVTRFSEETAWEFAREYAEANGIELLEEKK